MEERAHLSAARAIPEVAGVTLTRDLLGATPLVLRGVCADWPMVRAAKHAHAAALDYLGRFVNDATVTVSVGPPEIEGRLFYNGDLTGFNYEMERRGFRDVLTTLRELLDAAKPPLLYVGSTTIDACLPGFRAENALDIPGATPLASIWIGNRTRIAAHFDVPANVACVAAGRRRFTLFPPDQAENLYVGPPDFTLAGQPVSLVDFHDVDHARFPRFAAAAAHALVAELEPGDAIYIPSLWWHHIEGLEPLNVLINYWWRDAPLAMGNPMDAMMHAMLSVRDLPAHEREAWRALFEHYVFAWRQDDDAAHLPDHAQRALGPPSDDRARRLRAHLLNRLNK